MRSFYRISVISTFVLLLIILLQVFSQDTNPIKLYSLKKEVLDLYNKGQFSEAIPIAKKLLSLTEKAHGTEHPKTAERLDTIALLYDRMGDYAKVEPLGKRSLAIREKTFGSEHIDTVYSLEHPV